MLTVKKKLTPLTWYNIQNAIYNFLETEKTSLAESSFCKIPCKQSRNSTQNWTPPWMFLKEFLKAFWQTVFYANLKVFTSIRKELGTKCLKKLENWR